MSTVDKGEKREMAGLGRRRALKTKKKINGTRIKNGELVKRM